MKDGKAAKAAEVKEEPMETEDGAEAVPKENGESAEEGGEKADAETAGTICIELIRNCNHKIYILMC